MIVLGLSGALGHDASAAILVDGELIAAAEEERFLRDKHAKNRMPVRAAQYCLEAAGISADKVDVVAFPYASISLLSAARWRYAARHWYAPDRALDALFNGNRRFRKNRKRVLEAGDELGINWEKTEFRSVTHHLAHASSAYHLSGFRQKTAIFCVDGKGEYATTFLGFGLGDRIYKIKEFYDPDSLSGAYGAMTEYLGFEMLDGEYKVMGMAPFGDPDAFDFSRLIVKKNGGFKVDTRLLNTVGLRRYKENGKGFYFGRGLVEWLGPPRRDDKADEPYVHYAAAMQRLFEEQCLALIDTYLGSILAETGLIALAGGGALNVKLNQRILARSDVRELFVQPAAGDSGTSLGAATFVSSENGERVSRMNHVYLGPAFESHECEQAVRNRTEDLNWQRVENVVEVAADLIAAGNPVAWFQGRMEFGPRALGARSILGSPNAQGMSDRINDQIKYRERWRPFCPSLLDRVAADVISSDHSSPFMTITFDLSEHWKLRIPEVVHVDGTARVQVVEKGVNDRFYALIEALEARTGNAVVLNTSLNRRGEPIVCTPEDALNMFVECKLQYLLMEDILVTKHYA